MIINPFKTSNPYLEITKKMLADFFTIVGGITVLALACAAAIYTAIWFA
jgi:hypothetical protein